MSAAPRWFRELRQPVRYLFVVGTGLNSQLRPGAECLGLLRQVGAQIQERVILRVSLDELGKVIDEFKPAIVHIIYIHWIEENRRCSDGLRYPDRARDRK